MDSRKAEKGSLGAIKVFFPEYLIVRFIFATFSLFVNILLLCSLPWLLAVNQSLRFCR